MANEPIESAAPAAAPAIPAAAPSVESVAPAVTEAVAPVTTETAPSVAPEVVTTFLDKTPAATAPAEQPTAPATEKAPPAESDKSSENTTTQETPKDPGNQSDEPAPLPVYDSWSLPEGTQLDEAQTGEFNKLLGEFQNSTKAEQVAVQKFGQALVDRHIAAITDTIDRVHTAYANAWQGQTDGWREAFVKDPEIGGKRQETTIRLANEFIDTHGGTPEQKAAFRAVMKETGLGVNPEVLRLLSNAMNNFREGSPVPAMAPKPGLQSRIQRRYGKKTG